MLPLLICSLLSASPHAPDALSTDGHRGGARFTIRSTSVGDVLTYRSGETRWSVRLGGRNNEARFVAHDNLLVEAGCGAPCWFAVLLSPSGRALAQIMYPQAVNAQVVFQVEPLDLASGDVELTRFDLRTGRRIGSPERVAGLFNCERVTVEATHVRYRECPKGAKHDVAIWPR